MEAFKLGDRFTIQVKGGWNITTGFGIVLANGEGIVIAQKFEMGADPSDPGPAGVRFTPYNPPRYSIKRIRLADPLDNQAIIPSTPDLDQQLMSKDPPIGLALQAIAATL